METALRERFWERYSLEELTPPEWEALCDGCGRCCLVKLEDEDTGKVHYTNVACRFLDTETCRCTDYTNRCAIQPDCVKLSPDNLSVLDIMPSTCAYRLMHEGRRSLMDPDSLKVSGHIVSETQIPEDALQDYVIDWITTTD